NDKVKTPQQLVNLYYQSVGHNSLLLLNIPPNREGLLPQQDIENIMAFREILNETFKINFAKDKVPSSLTDKKLNTFISLTANHPYIIDFKKVIKTDRAMLQENIANGQRIIKGLLEYWDGDSWKKMEEFTTVGYKRLFRFKAIASQKIRLTILESKGKVQLAEVGFFKASAKE
ncbi:MAG: alpha-L-fucosidase, partial [Bacteroidia bacterium]